MKTLIHGICRTCGKGFTSRHPNKMFCNWDCYIRSEKYKENQAKVREATLRQRSPENYHNCETCGDQFYSSPSLKQKYCSRKCYYKSQTNKPKLMLRKPRIKVKCMGCKKVIENIVGGARNRKFCTYSCYRLYFADRFDRWIASPEAILNMQNYDEFLCQEELPCIIEGCEWKGIRLGNHVNFAHGITASEFKELAGFNRSTGLSTLEDIAQLRAVSSNMSTPEGFGPYEKGQEFPEGHGKYERRKETIEHMAKRMTAHYKNDSKSQAENSEQVE